MLFYLTGINICPILTRLSYLNEERIVPLSKHAIDSLDSLFFKHIKLLCIVVHVQCIGGFKRAIYG